MSKRTPVRDLSCSVVDVQPVTYDWSEGHEIEWESREAVECQKCGKVLVLGTGGGEDTHSALDSNSDCDGYVGQAEGPRMSYFYPLPSTYAPSEEDVAKLAHLPLCVVEFTGGGFEGHALALTGGGMDLTWEIAEAYMVLGFLPPFHYARLPAICGRGTSARDKWIAAGCIKSCRVIAGWAKSRAQQTKRTLEFSSKLARETGAEESP